MNSTSNDTTFPAESTAAGRMPSRPVGAFLRLFLALVLTPTLLVYQWGKLLVLGMMDNRIHWPAFGILFGGIAVIVLLTARLSEKLRDLRIEPFVLQIVAGCWIAVTALIIWLYSGDLLPKGVIVGLFVPATFWVVWLAWMFYRPWRWSRRLLGLATCLLLVIPFPLLLKPAGLTGNARVNFVWKSFRRDAPPAQLFSTGSIVSDEGLPAEAARGADVPATTPHDYPQFLGPNRTGVVSSVRLSPDWKDHPPREVWRQPVGAGWSSHAVVADFAVTQEQHGVEEAIVCRRVSSGALVWMQKYPAEFGGNPGESTMGGLGPRATPAIALGRIYAVGATGKFHALDLATGRVLWKTDIQQDNEGHGIAHGVCASPLVDGEQVIVAPTGNRAASLAAYDRETGRKNWHAGKFAASYGSPALVELDGRRQILLYTDEGVESHAPETGEFLWNFTWTNNVRVNCSQPLVIDEPAGRLLIATGYDNGSVLLEVAPGEPAWSIREIWNRPRELKTKFTTAVRLGEFVYGLDDGILACLDLASGKRQWKAGRYQHGQILLAGELLIVQAENGEVVLVRPSPTELIELGRIPALTGKTWNNPALAGRFLLVRNDHESACYELPLAD